MCGVMNVRLIHCCGFAPLETPNVFHITLGTAHYLSPHCKLLTALTRRARVQSLLLDFTFGIVVARRPLETLHPVNSQRLKLSWAGYSLIWREKKKQSQHWPRSLSSELNAFHKSHFHQYLSRHRIHIMWQIWHFWTRTTKLKNRWEDGGRLLHMYVDCGW